MRIIIAGGRDFNNYNYLREGVKNIISLLERENPGITESIEFVSGGARGADSLGEQFANYEGYPVKRFPAEWKIYGRKAGPIRNEQMAKYAAQDQGVLIAFWDHKSKGTESMIRLAHANRVRIYLFSYSNNF